MITAGDLRRVLEGVDDSTPLDTFLALVAAELATPPIDPVAAASRWLPPRRVRVERVIEVAAEVLDVPLPELLAVREDGLRGRAYLRERQIAAYALRAGPWRRSRGVMPIASITHPSTGRRRPGGDAAREYTRR